MSTPTSKFGRTVVSTSRTAVEAVGEPKAKKAPTKYTFLMDDDVVLTLMEDEARMRREAGSAPKRSEIFRILLELLHEDQSLFDEVVRRYLASPEAARRGRAKS